MTGIVHAFFYCYQSTKQFMTTTNPENINKTVVYIQPITHHKHDLLNLLCLTLVLPDRYPRASLRESERESDQCSDRGSFLPHNTFCRAPNKLFPLKRLTLTFVSIAWTFSGRNDLFSAVNNSHQHAVHCTTNEVCSRNFFPAKRQS